MFVLFVVAAMSAAPEFTAQLSGGQQVAGQLSELSADRVVLKTADGPRNVHGEAIELRRNTATEPSRSPVGVDLWDGSTLAASDYRLTGKKALVKLASGSEIQLDATTVSTVRFHDQAPDIARQWNEILRAGRTDDLLVVRKQDALDSLAGVIGDVNDETVQFTLGDEALQVKRTKVEGLVFAQPAGAARPRGAFCTLIDRFGTKLAAQRVKIEGGAAKVMSPSGVELSMPLEQLALVRFNVQFLSDLEPEQVVYTPFVAGRKSLKAERAFFGPRLNRGLEPSGMRLGERQFSKGITMHSRSELVFRLPGGFSRFQATAGIDDSVRPGGNVRLLVYGDDRLLAEQVITGRDEPRRLDVDIRGAARLKIVADYNGDEVADHLDLCEARILQ